MQCPDPAMVVDWLRDSPEVLGASSTSDMNFRPGTTICVKPKGSGGEFGA